MKKALRISGAVAVLFLVALTGGFIYFNTVYPDVEAPKKIKIEASAERIARGKYLAEHVAVCMDCHSTRDWTKFSGPAIESTYGKGGDKFDEAIGFPGTIYVKNITPAAIGNWTDGEIIQAITNGVNKNGEALFPVMPYKNYNTMSEEDLYSIVAYLKSLKPQKAEYPERELNFPLNFIVKTLPEAHYKPNNNVDKSNSVEYGKYLVNLSGCEHCHTPSEEGAPIPGKEFSGGMEINLPIGILRSANISPDVETGIGAWTKETFIARFKAYDPSKHDYINVKEGEFNSIMPWAMYAGMTEEDLGAIYDYLRMVKPVKNRTERFTPHKPGLAQKF